VPLPCEGMPCSGQWNSHQPRRAAGGICSQGAAAKGVIGAVGAGCSQHRCGVWRSLRDTPLAAAHVACVVWDVGGAGRDCCVCSLSSRRCCSRTVRTAFRRSMRGRRRAERSLVGWLGAALAHRLLLAAAERDWAQVQARTCRASPLLPFVSLPSAHSNQRRCAVLEHGSTSTYKIAGTLRVRLDRVGRAAVGLGRSRRVSEGRRGAGAAPVECSS
jgi:hypothetical protein